MKNIKKYGLSIVLTLTLLMGLAACSTDTAQENSLAGTYTVGTGWNQMSYEFREENAFTLHMQSMSYEYASVNGTYEISEDGSEITFVFSLQGDVSFGSLSSYAGTFPFERTENGILIGNVYYEKTEDLPKETASEDAAANSGSAAVEEPVALNDISLKLPQEPFTIQYEVTEEGHGISRTYCKW